MRFGPWVGNRKHCLQLNVFFQEINTNGFFHVSENCQHYLLYWLLYLKLFFFLLESRCVSTPWIVFLAQAHHTGKPMFSLLVNLILIKTCWVLFVELGGLLTPSVTRLSFFHVLLRGDPSRFYLMVTLFSLCPSHMLSLFRPAFSLSTFGYTAV